MLQPLLLVHRFVARFTHHVFHTTLSLPATAAAWTAGEVTGRAIDAGWLHMPSVNSAKAFLAVFGCVLLFEIAHAFKAESTRVAEHTPERRPVTIVSLRDEGADARKSVREWLATYRSFNTAE